MAIDRRLDVVVDGLGFPEGLRWHEGELWFSDFRTRRVSSVDRDGKVTTRGYVAAQPSGLGWRPDGTTLVVSMIDQHVLALTEPRMTRVASLAGVCVGSCNDMVVDRLGRAYVGSMGYDSLAGMEAFAPSSLAFVDVDGTVRAAADDLHLPNGMVLTPDGSTLVVAETVGGRLSAFDVAPDGSLSNRRVFAELPGRGPDGICMDASGAIWVACWFSHEFVRVAEGGEILDVIDVGSALSPCCVLGGERGDTLFCSVVDASPEEVHRGEARAAIYAAAVGSG